MPQEIDLRDVNSYVRFTVGPGDLPAGAVAKEGSFAERALGVAQFINDVFGAQAGEPVDLVPDPGVQTTGSGAAIVHLNQYHHGIPVFRASQSVRFSPSEIPERSELQLAAGKIIPEVAFRVSSDQAVTIAARHVSEPDDATTETDGSVPSASPVDLSSFTPTVIASFPDLSAVPVVYAPGPFAEPIKVNLVWFPLEDRLQLAWETVITLPDYTGMFLTIVAASDGTVVFCKPLMSSAECRGNVFRSDPDQRREMTDFPLPWDAHGFGVPADLPGQPTAWVASDNTEGDFAEAFLNDTLLTVRGAAVDGVLTFDPTDPEGPDQQVVNAFFGACLMHDFAYMFGFREANSSYQLGSVGPTGLAGQRVRVSVLTGPLKDTAHWVPVTNPLMRFGRKTTTDRHSALDLTIVLHEYTHGMCNRLVAGATTRAPLMATQSRGMSEGWGDYVACMVTGKRVFGGWVADDPGKGLRRFAYDDNFPVEQVHFGVIKEMTIYQIGEMWCATLLEMTRSVGAELGLKLVINGMKGLKIDPNVIQGRDSILSEVEDMRTSGQLTAAELVETRDAVWAAFAKFGMGVAARSADAELSGTFADTTAPS